MVRELDVDDALYEVGGFRKWHILAFLMVVTSGFSPLTWLELTIVFIGHTPPHHCKVPDGMAATDVLPTEDNHGTVSYKSCEMYVDKTVGNTTMDCTDGWTYHLETSHDKYITTEWDLVCEDNYLAELSQTIYQVGCLFGQLIGSNLSDRFGRKKIHIFGNIIVSIIGVCTAFSTQYIAFALLRGVLGFAITLNVYAGFVLMLELFDSKRRVFVGIGFNLWWVVLYEVLPFMAYFIRNWRYLHAIFGLYSLVWIIYIWVLPESPFWLTANGKYEQAKEDIVGIAIMNGVEMEEFTLKKHPKHLEQQSSLAEEAELLPIDTKPDPSLNDDVMPHDGSTDNIVGDSNGGEPDILHATELKVWHIFLDSKLRIHAFVASMFWLAANMVYYGLILSTPSLAGNRFINYVIGGLVEIPAYLLAIYCAKRFGRRLSSAVFLIFTSVPLGITLFIPEATASGVNLGPLRVVTAMLAKFGISATFGVIILYTTELFPTNLRTSSMGLCNILGRIGGMVAPLAAYAAKRLYWLPNVVFSIIVMTAGLLVLLLPETGDRPLPATLHDIHQLYKPMEEEDQQQGDMEHTDQETNFA